ncbi:efflux RND transporter periplasmic adaptor subunit [Tenacibaculum amylolyticum]|uniref:efflux RND transporter periplasmic adaptor subunit n=1 Tax=Tenacibaculum amylolyticum TaxID=104269 RepID=UPI0038963615
MKSLILFLVACTLLTSCNSHKEHHKEHIKFKVTSPIKMDTIITKDYVCQIHAIRHIELRALEKGYLQKIWVDEGQFVKEGQAMFKIMPNVYEAELQKANAEEDVASIEYKNTKLLAESNIVSPNELAMSKAKLDKAKAEVTMAKTHLGFTNIKAPFAGIMDHLHVREGSLLDEGELLTTLSDNSKMWVYFNVPEVEYLDYVMNGEKDKKKEVSLLLANNREFNQKGVVEVIEGEFNNETGNIAFRATFPNPDKILRHGETGSILMKIPFNNALIIPQKATFEVLDKKFVFVVDEHNEIHQREITIEAELPHLFIVKKGLKQSDKFVLDGIRLVKEGEHISYDFIAPKKAISNLELYAE